MVRNAPRLKTKKKKKSGKKKEEKNVGKKRRRKKVKIATKKRKKKSTWPSRARFVRTFEPIGSLFNPFLGNQNLSKVPQSKIKGLQ